MNMKTKLLLQTPAAIFILLAALAASAQPAPQIDPTTGLSVRTGVPAFNPATGLYFRGSTPAPAFDPNTGLPISAPTTSSEPQWIDPSWKDPNIVLTNVNYNNLPLSEVARDLRERFKDYFDILPMPHTFDQDWGSDIAVQLQLKNVKASEVFNAMNLVFENDRTPVRWELRLNGNRPVARLSVLITLAPKPEPSQPKPAETRRMVFFIGNLLGDEKSGGMTMGQITKTINSVWPAEFGTLEGVIQFHEQAELIIVNGTREQIDFIQQILSALRQKADTEHARQADSDPSAKAEADIRMKLNQARQKELNRMPNTQDPNSSGAR
jgi:hypothetical protein